jgi:hypothetical protein
MRRVADSRARIRRWRRRLEEVLAHKGLDSALALTRAIRSDLTTSIMAARELTSVGQRALMEEFFAGEPQMAEAVLDAADAVDVAHIGFRIAEPLDIYLEGVPIWADRLGADVVGTKRIPASEHFQDRVGAFVEMAQVWFGYRDREIELEVFDIHRSYDLGSDAPIAPGSDMSVMSAQDRAMLRLRLAGDEIWHYGVTLASAGLVRDLHERLLMLANRSDRYSLRNTTVVTNLDHGSVHTKVSNHDLALEIEFLSYAIDDEGADLAV